MTFNFNRRLKKRLMIAKHLGFKKPSNFLTSIPEDTIVVGTNSIPPISLQVLTGPLTVVAGEVIIGINVQPPYTQQSLTVRVTNINTDIPRRNVNVTATLWDGSIDQLSSETFSSDSTVTVVSDANGYCVFNNLRVEKTGSYRIGYKCFNHDGSLVEFKPFTSDDTSVQFLIIPASVKRIAIDRQPPDSIEAGLIISPGPQVTIYDEYNNPTSLYNVRVSLNKNTFFSGTTSRLVLSPTPPTTFNNLTIAIPATGYRMIFDVLASSTPSITSTPFDITPRPLRILNITEPTEEKFLISLSSSNPDLFASSSPLISAQITGIYPPSGNLVTFTFSPTAESPTYTGLLTLQFATTSQYIYVRIPVYNFPIATYDRFNERFYNNEWKQFIDPPPPTVMPPIVTPPPEPIDIPGIEPR